MITRRVNPVGPRAPLIITSPGHATIHAYENHEHFVEALRERSEETTVTVILQVTHIPRRRRRESDYIDVEILEDPFTYSGATGKDIELDGSPKLKLPTTPELEKFAAKYGAIGARAVVRAPLLAPLHGGSAGRPARYLYGREE